MISSRIQKNKLIIYRISNQSFKFVGQCFPKPSSKPHRHEKRDLNQSQYSYYYLPLVLSTTALIFFSKLSFIRDQIRSLTFQKLEEARLTLKFLFYILKPKNNIHELVYFKLKAVRKSKRERNRRKRNRRRIRRRRKLDRLWELKK